ncbi:uncharacterized protein [Panulirus ornatus]|uniref:uncharacterized protein n=1 Tax=Panulirus ornatus TaxID=150431 RepID=UPI003A8C70D3
MRWRYLSNPTLRLMLLVSVGVVLMILYCYVPAVLRMSLEPQTSMMPINSSGSLRTPKPRIIDDPYWATNQDVWQSTHKEDYSQQEMDNINYKTSKETETTTFSPELNKDFSNIKISTKHYSEAKINPYKIELMDDNGEDSSVNLFTLSLKEIMQGVEHIHQVAMAHKKEASQYPKYKENYQNTNHNSHHAQEKKIFPLSSLNNSTCDVKINLNPCKCTRHLSPTLTFCPSHELKQSEIVAIINETLGESTCSEWATMRGDNQSVVSFSLFGKFPSPYYRGASALMQRVSKMYPDWSVRFYHDLDLSDPVKRNWMCSLACRYQHLDFCSVKNLPAGLGDIRWTIGTVWRLAIMGDPLVKRYIIRDTDSPILQREVDAVQEWLNSDKCFHMMRDNPEHSQAIMGGAWGGCDTWHPEAMPRLRDLVFRWSSNNFKDSQDQINVVQLLWPTLKKNHLAHDAYWCHKFPSSQPFPSRRLNYTFVGMRSFRGDYSDDSVHQPCPVQCRPAKHKDWIYC